MSPSDKPAILLLGKIIKAHDAWSTISSKYTVITPQSKDRESFLKELSSPSLSSVAAIYRDFTSSSVTGRLDATFFDALPPSCRFIASCGAGYDMIDIPSATERKICVSNTPTAVNDATADAGVFLLLGALRNFNAGMTTLRKGEWLGKGKKVSLGHDPRGKTVGIVGMGGIGRNMAEKLRAFGMKVTYYNRNRLDPEKEEGAEYRDFETLLKESDVISMNLPLNPSTRHTLSTKEFALMKPGVIIVNTARGAVIDEAALVEALDSGKVASAGLDVFEDEPNVHPGLISNDKVILVPHMGTYTVETIRKMEEWAINNLTKAVEEKKLITIVPEQRDLEKELNRK